jgi:hypothetical protein
MSMNYNWVIQKTDGSEIHKRDKNNVLTPYHLDEANLSEFIAAKVVSGKGLGKGVLQNESRQAVVDTIPSINVDRSNIQTFALQNEQGNTQVSVDVPPNGEVFQRHRVTAINYYSRFHDIAEQIPEHVENGRYIPAKTLVKTYPEITYDDVWLIGYRKRELDGIVTVFFKALYPDGKIEEHNAFNEKPWLYEPEWFAEEAV